MGVDICWVKTEMLDAFPDEFAKFPVVLAGAVVLDDDELICAILDLTTKPSEGIPEGVEMVEGSW